MLRDSLRMHVYLYTILKDRLDNELSALEKPKIIDVQTSVDGTIKFLIELKN